MPPCLVMEYAETKKEKKKKKRTRTIKQRNIELREDISWLIRNLLHLDFTRDSISEWRGNGESLSRECLYEARDLRFHSMRETIKVDLFHFQARSDRWIDRWIIHETFPWLRSKYRFAISFTVLFSGTVPSIGTVHSQFQGSRCTYIVIWPEKMG